MIERFSEMKPMLAVCLMVFLYSAFFFGWVFWLASSFGFSLIDGITPREIIDRNIQSVDREVALMGGVKVGNEIVGDSGIAIYYVADAEDRSLERTVISAVSPDAAASVSWDNSMAVVRVDVDEAATARMSDEGWWQDPRVMVHGLSALLALILTLSPYVLFMGVKWPEPGRRPS